MKSLKIITGKKYSGKSSYLLSKAKHYLKQNINVGGIISQKDKGNGYNAVLVSNMKTHPPETFIRRIAYSNHIFKNFSFEEAIFDKVYDMINFNFDIFILDEVGQLEIIHNKGYTKVLHKILSTYVNNDFKIIMSVKEGLIREFIEKFKILDLFCNNTFNQLTIKRIGH